MTNFWYALLFLTAFIIGFVLAWRRDEKKKRKQNAQSFIENVERQRKLKNLKGDIDAKHD